MKACLIRKDDQHFIQRSTEDAFHRNPEHFQCKHEHLSVLTEYGRERQLDDNQKQHEQPYCREHTVLALPVPWLPQRSGHVPTWNKKVRSQVEHIYAHDDDTGANPSRSPPRTVGGCCDCLRAEGARDLSKDVKLANHNADPQTRCNDRQRGQHHTEDWVVLEAPPPHDKVQLWWRR